MVNLGLVFWVEMGLGVFVIVGDMVGLVGGVVEFILWCVVGFGVFDVLVGVGWVVCEFFFFGVVVCGEI